MKNKPKIKVTAGQLLFVLPYIERELPDYEIVTDGESDYSVAIFEMNESFEPSLQQSTTILRCPNVVGTGMTGFPMEMAKLIASGSYFNINGNEARMSTVHATDVAVAVRLSLGAPGCWVITDGSNPKYSEFADALAFRIKDRRIFSINSKIARFLLPKSIRKAVVTDSVVDGREFADKFGFTPTPVTYYLRNHDYNDESL